MVMVPLATPVPYQSPMNFSLGFSLLQAAKSTEMQHIAMMVNFFMMWYLVDLLLYQIKISLQK